MTAPAHKTPQWIYEGLWGVLTKWFRVPKEPPSLPTLPGEGAHAFRPAEGFLRYKKFQFWLGLLFIDVLIFAGWLALTVAVPPVGLLLAPVALVLAVAPDIVAYVAIHLHYDTTWYVLTDRSLRIRRGIWTVKEITITFENVQNVAVTQGPLQRHYGIADVRVDTAGGGAAQQTPQGTATSAHAGLIEGVAGAEEIRGLILARLKSSRTAGLGDETGRDRRPSLWGPAHIEALRDIRDALR